ncbi:GNAT family N-acetyltransferase [Sphingobacterium sp. UDSM-2020]|uniref:GNAT family N-acetyltransferase n=1 Tax=Sphingobacterium sp. UDSM-2020 TaxID=2795738 RepID=UPI0019387440|nr:GNAT family N-acetyltransferase [Sphingobacterium sp. UDSM-2020]QQD13047.1 GNAT family N-acetyltransferase [Sphingobacterium sp. UDSM-2020]
MTKAIIRTAVEADCPAMLELIKELAILEKAPNEVTVSMEEFIDAGFGQNPIWGAFIAEFDEKIVGISLYYIRYSTWKGRRLYLEDLIVTESMRGYGIGKQLFEETINYGKSKGYQGMVWQVLDWNEPAIQFYRKYKADFDAEWINVSITY